MFTFAVPASLPKPTDISSGTRPRQSNVIVFKSVMKVTLFSSGNVCVVTTPSAPKSIVTLYVPVVTICTDD
jgi:hypothetical protein